MASQTDGLLFVVPLHDPGITCALFIGFEKGFVFLKGVSEGGISGEVAAFVGVGGDVEEFELRAVDVGVDGAPAIVGVRAFFPLRLPGGGGPEVGGEGIGLTIGDVPDELVVTVANNTHGVIHLDLVEGVGGSDLVPAF